MVDPIDFISLVILQLLSSAINRRWEITLNELRNRWRSKHHFSEVLPVRIGQSWKSAQKWKCWNSVRTKPITCLILWHNFCSPNLENFILRRGYFKRVFFTSKNRKNANFEKSVKNYQNLRNQWNLIQQLTFLYRCQPYIFHCDQQCLCLGKVCSKMANFSPYSHRHGLCFNSRNICWVGDRP